MSRLTINCPSCHRELYHLHRPQCSWCGAALSEEEYEKVALPLGEPLTPDLPPMLPLPPISGSPHYSRGWGLSNQPQTLLLELNFMKTLLLVCVILLPLAYFLWGKYHVHPIVPLVH